MGDDVIQDKVMRQTNPREMLKHGRRATNFNHIPDNDLEREEERIMARGIRKKFTQNKDMRAFLMDTAPRIGESSKTNPRWGTGLHLHHKDCFNTNKWAKNLLGDLLVNQRTLFMN